MPPNRVRYPADRLFTSSCFSPRLTTTQLPSVTELWFPPTRTCTVLIRHPRGRTTQPLRGSPVRPDIGLRPLVGQADNCVTLSQGTSIVGKAQSAGNGPPFSRTATQPTLLVPWPFGSCCASATLCCVSCQGSDHCLRNAPRFTLAQWL